MVLPDYRSYPLIDCHIHHGHPDLNDSLIAIMDQFSIDRLNILCTPDETRLSLVPDALHLKSLYPERVYVFGGLDITALFVMAEQAGEFFAGYVDALLNMGCDGIKMIEGKPDMRQMLPIPDFDSDVYTPYWEKMSADGVPLLFHVNDPEEFWDADNVPDWALEQGWFYGDGSYINNEVQYTQVLNVLDRFPDLNVIFAHFFFLSAQLERLAEYFDRYPNMCVDLTPGIEMYRNFALHPEKARDFFIKYQDRILYGTDIGALALLGDSQQSVDEADSLARVYVVRSFLETEGPFIMGDRTGFLFGDPELPFQGINLPDAALEKIYYKNFERLAGQRPRPLDPAAIIAECERLEILIPAMGAMQPGAEGDASVAQMVKAHFESV